MRKNLVIVQSAQAKKVLKSASSDFLMQKPAAVNQYDQLVTSIYPDLINDGINKANPDIWSGKGLFNATGALLPSFISSEKINVSHLDQGIYTLRLLSIERNKIILKQKKNKL